MIANEYAPTFILNTGVTVVAKFDRDGSIEPIRYSNRTQAARKAQSIGGAVYQPRLGPVFYVIPKSLSVQHPDMVEELLAHLAMQAASSQGAQA